MGVSNRTTRKSKPKIGAGDFVVITNRRFRNTLAVVERRINHGWLNLNIGQALPVPVRVVHVRLATAREYMHAIGQIVS